MLRFFFALVLPFSVAYGGSPFHGSWAFELPDGNPAWLKVEEGEGDPVAELLWSVGSSKRVEGARVEEGVLHFHRQLKWKPYGKAEDVRVLTGDFTGSLVKNGFLRLEVEQFPEREPREVETLRLFGKKMPPLPPAPDLAMVTFGEPVFLFDGKSLEGWVLSNPEKKNGWRAEDGELVNETPKTDFGAYGEFGNLRTEALFEDFRLSLEYQVPSGGNSGVYLRGMYEAQVVDRDSPMQGIQGPGAIFGRIAPIKNAGRPGGEWNRYVLTLVDRHITVELNGLVVIDNQPIEGCTGGGISADDSAPGPILLQGDHTSVRFRDLVLEPVVRE